MEFTNRSAAAYLGSWQSFATKSTHNYTDTTFQHHYPHAANHINDAYQRIKHHLPPDHPKPTWTRWTTNAHDLSQTTLTKLIYNHIYDQLYLTTTNLPQDHPGQHERPCEWGLDLPTPYPLNSSPKYTTLPHYDTDWAYNYIPTAPYANTTTTGHNVPNHSTHTPTTALHATPAHTGHKGTTT